MEGGNSKNQKKEECEENISAIVFQVKIGCLQYLAKTKEKELYKITNSYQN